MRYRITKSAEQDLDEIFDYWAKRASSEIADRLIDDITGRFWLLGAHPESGKVYEELPSGVRCFPAGKYLIYYRARRNRTEILHIFHGARDQQRAFKTAKKSPKGKL